MRKKGILQKAFTCTFHSIPHTKYKVGYFPKGSFPSSDELFTLHALAQEKKCIFIQLEPNIVKCENLKLEFKNLDLRPSFHPLFTKFSFILDITPSEEELLKNMHSKTRYNIRLAQKRGVYIEEDNSEKGLEQYLKLTKETTKRQGFFAHSSSYHRKLWETLPKNTDTDSLTYHLFHARFKDEHKTVHTLVSWVVFVFHDTLYYPYGASSSVHREFMASNLMAFEAIRFGKKLGLKRFDMWGALGPDADPKDPWYGFHRFKEGYGATLTEFIGSYDLVENKNLYMLYKAADTVRWAVLHLRK